MSMRKRVVLIDYGVGNLLSVARAFEHVGAAVQVTADPQAIVAAERVVFPGVGAFGTAMQALTQQGLVEAIQQFTGKERPFLGICLGMQMMLDESEEFGIHPGLGLIGGRINAIPLINPAGERCKVPHIGWSRISSAAEEQWNNPLLSGVSPGSYMYFVHSFHAVPREARQVLAVTRYNAMPLAAVVGKEHLYGCQFHPEKSGAAGLKILSNFMSL